MSANSHPARSPEFLSRLHDGELSPAERAHFESHRAHCVECRSSAAEFEAALSLYRSSIPAPAAPDLASRILRKLQANASRRQRFGPTFGIDLRWAGAFAAAVVAAIVGSAIVAQNESRQRVAARVASVPVSLESAPAPAAPPPAAAADSPAEEHAEHSAAEPSFRARAGRETPKREELAKEKKDVQALAAGGRANTQNGNTGALDERTAENRSGNLLDYAETDASKQAPSSAAAAAPPAQSGAREKGQVQDKGQIQTQAAMKSAGAPRAEAPAVERRQDAFAAQQAAPRDTDRAGGEGAAAPADQLRPAVSTPVRLVVSPLDGISFTPNLIVESAADVPVSLRGQKFIVLVDTAGRVREVGPWPKARASSPPPQNQPSPPQEQARGQKSLARAKDADSPLRALRFQAGDAPRRLLVRVE